MIGQVDKEQTKDRDEASDYSDDFDESEEEVYLDDFEDDSPMGGSLKKPLAVAASPVDTNDADLEYLDDFEEDSDEEEVLDDILASARAAREVEDPVSKPMMLCASVCENPMSKPMMLCASVCEDPVSKPMMFCASVCEDPVSKPMMLCASVRRHVIDALGEKVFEEVCGQLETSSVEKTLAERIQHYVKDIYGEEVWRQIRALAGVENRVFVTHQCYSDDLFLELAEGAAGVIGKEKGLETKDFMKYFGTLFVKFFSNYGYDRIIRVTGRNLTDFLNGIDNIHEHMRFGYPKMQSPSFYCEDETSTGITLHYVSKRQGFKYYVIGQIEQIAQEFFSKEIEISIIGEQATSRGSHVIYRLLFDNQATSPISPGQLSLPCKTLQNTLPLKTFFDVFPFSMVILEDMTMGMAGSCLLTTLGSEVLGQKVTEVFSLRRPKTEFSWEN
ncbi:hypothetical protein QZH41_004872 [Actinostola sp. cb2023]|nr:hypothetical protein QZH41_004872 [Actinostola sp. cb2023]